jgi:hypothetical protein
LKRFFVLAQSEFTARALDAFLSLAGIEKEQRNCVVHTTPLSRDDAGVGDYQTLVGKIGRAVADECGGRPLNTTILVDSIRPDNLSAVEESGNWDNLVAMLILTFPEVRWLFGATCGSAVAVECKQNPFPEHTLAKLFGSTYRGPLLDPTGLRDWVRAKTNEAISKNTNDDLILPQRPVDRRAAAIDDEPDFAFFNAYTAYRFGCLSEVITNWQSMKGLFGPKKEDNPTVSICSTPHPYWLLIEDMCLNFPDRPVATHLSNLKDRANECKLLDSENSTAEPSAHRILVTGQTRPGDRTLAENRDYLRRFKRGRGRNIYKPVNGMFDLWGRIGLLRKKAKKRRAGNVDGFSWPPAIPSKRDEENGAGHGAPGKLLLVAETLIHRAENMLVNTITSIERAILGAVLVTDSLELTGGRTPTTAIEALLLKHRFEVMMECMFLGNEYNIHVEERFREIEYDLKMITIWSHRRMRKLTVMNANMSVIIQIMRIFREHGQFDEELHCLRHTRKLNRRLFFAKHPGLFFLRPLRWYIDTLIGSLSLLAAALVVWPVALGGMMSLLGTSWENLKEVTFIDHVTNAFYMFIAQTPAGFPQGFWAHTLTFGASLIGIVHFGVFIAYLYNLFYRR